MRCKIDSEKCIGCGNCVALTESKVFDFNDEGLATAIVDEVPEGMEETVNDAIEQCPTGAISLDEEEEFENQAA